MMMLTSIASALPFTPYTCTSYARGDRGAACAAWRRKALAITESFLWRFAVRAVQ
jgi:hypothetical protein